KSTKTTFFSFLALAIAVSRSCFWKAGLGLVARGFGVVEVAGRGFGWGVDTSAGFVGAMGSPPPGGTEGVTSAGWGCWVGGGVVSVPCVRMYRCIPANPRIAQTIATMTDFMDLASSVAGSGRARPEQRRRGRATGTILC